MGLNLDYIHTTNFLYPDVFKINKIQTIIKTKKALIMAKIFIGIGILFLIIGLIYLFFPNAFSWFGRMPGDVNYRSEGGGFSFHFPIVTMIIVSIILTIILNLFNR